MAKFYTYDQIGKAEDVSDVISNIAPTDTPFQSSLKSEGVDATNPQWQEDSLDAAASNAAIEGADAGASNHVPTVMRSNYTQILTKTVEVTNTADRVKKYGRKSELAYQLAKKGKEIKRDREWTMVGLAQAATVGSSAAARLMASAQPQIVAGNTNSNAGIGRAFSETIALDVLQKVYNSGGEASIMMIKPGDASIVAGFAAASGTGQRDFGTGQKVVNAVSIYVSPWGEVKVVLNRFIKPAALGHALFYDPSYWRILTLRDWNRTKLAVTGDAERHLLVGEFSLKHSNFSASGIATDLN